MYYWGKPSDWKERFHLCIQPGTKYIVTKNGLSRISGTVMEKCHIFFKPFFKHFSSPNPYNRLFLFFNNRFCVTTNRSSHVWMDHSHVISFPLSHNSRMLKIWKNLLFWFAGDNITLFDFTSIYDQNKLHTTQIYVNFQFGHTHQFHENFVLCINLKITSQMLLNCFKWSNNVTQHCCQMLYLNSMILLYCEQSIHCLCQIVCVRSFVLLIETL